MFVAVVLLYMLLAVNCDDVVRYKCGKDVEDASMTFTPAVDGVQGRYTVELCTMKNPNVILWQLNLWYYNDPARCRSGRKPDGQHSVMKEHLNAPNNCTNVCFSVDFDLIFKACYNIQSALGTSYKWLRPKDIYITVNNNITKDIYEKNTPHVSFIPHEKMVTLHWYLGLPVTFYDVIIMPRNNNSIEYDQQVNVTEQCAMVTWNEVKCQLELSEGCYQANFQHYSTWTTVFNEQATVYFPFCVEAGCRPVVGGGSTLAWWAGGAGGVAAVLLAALLARHRRAHQPLRKTHFDTPSPQRAEVVRPPARQVLLLYAREGETAQRAVEALKVTLRAVTGVQVVDLFSPEVVSAAADAPGAWLRAALQSDEWRVVLLQTPALAALYTTHVHQHSLQVSRPLLGRRAIYRHPQFGDQLLLLALRLISESVAAHHEYTKYYVATYRGLITEVLPALVPYRRYLLPAALPTLLRDLAPAPNPHDPSDPTDPLDLHDLDLAALERYGHMVEDFVVHAQRNPEYLTDELIFT